MSIPEFTKVFSLAELNAAHEVVKAHVAPTPQLVWPLISELAGCEVVVKHENHTPVGAFKVRGGLSYVDYLRREKPHIVGIVSATRGNHGQSLAFAGGHGGLAVTIVVPKGNSAEKNAAMRALGAKLIEHGEDFQEAAEFASNHAAKEGLEMVPSFHRDLVIGVATYGLELMQAHADLDRIYVAIGQGSGICGTIMARDLLNRKTEIIGVQAEGAPAYALSFAERRKVTTERAQTFADGVATRTPVDAALSLILAGASRVMTVSDREIAEAVLHYWRCCHNLAEGAGAIALAAALKDKAQNRGKKIGVILSGGNIDLELFNDKVVKPLLGQSTDRLG